MTDNWPKFGSHPSPESDRPTYNITVRAFLNPYSKTATDILDIYQHENELRIPVLELVSYLIPVAPELQSRTGEYRTRMRQRGLIVLHGNEKPGTLTGMDIGNAAIEAYSQVASEAVTDETQLDAFVEYLTRIYTIDRTEYGRDRLWKYTEGIDRIESAEIRDAVVNREHQSQLRAQTQDWLKRVKNQVVKNPNDATLFVNDEPISRPNRKNFIRAVRSIKTAEIMSVTPYTNDNDDVMHNFDIGT